MYYYFTIRSYFDDNVQDKMSKAIVDVEMLEVAESILL